MKVACPFCGAFRFPEERSYSCCKNGAVWIPPMKLIPDQIAPVFERKYKGNLIASNAAFAMASVRYHREAQRAHGIQSMKVKGIVSSHPSAVHPRDERNPRFANFIVLEGNNKEIAEKRYETIKAKPNPIREKIFEDIQTYMSENNVLYHTYKSMYEIEQDFKKDKETAESVKDARIKFRIVSPSELSDEDIKLLNAHKGVYARPARMPHGYVCVAYTWNAQDEVQLPRGRDIYPRNPKKNPQEPLSIYSELVDTMSYPLLFPEGTGGWGLHKYERLNTKPPNSAIAFIDRIKTHLALLKDVGENPEDYYEMSDEEIRLIIEEQFDIEVEAENDFDYDMPFDFGVDEENDDGEFYDEEDPYEAALREEDPMYFDDDQILAHGELEDMQDQPNDENEVGRQANVRMVERGGELYPVIDREVATVEIPFVSGNPFGDESSDNDEEEPDYDRYQTCEYENPIGLEDDDNLDQQYRDLEAWESLNMMATCVEEAEGCTTAPDEYNFDDDVFFGDEHIAEGTALGRNNDGVRVKNLGTRPYVSLSEYANFGIQFRRGIPSKFQGRSRTLGQLYIIDLANRVREMRMNALTEKRAEFPRATDRSALLKVYHKMLQDKYEGRKKLGMIVTMPSTVPGTSKYQRELVMSAVTMANKLGNPHLFITFTGNSEWDEIKRACEQRKCEWADIPDFVNRVFKRKFELLLEDVIGKQKKSSKDNGKYIREPGMFGPVIWYNYSVEFQQRGMPHCHLLICLENPITCAAQIDEIISAEVPDLPDADEQDSELKRKKIEYYKLVKSLMVHRKCEDDPEAYCNKEKKSHWKKCCRGFPKKLTDNTILSDNQYPDYRRTEKNTFSVFNKGVYSTVGSEYVVAHNKTLLMKYKCHMNIEIVSSIKTMKYMFKYIHKGADRVLLEATETTARGTFAADSMTLADNVFVPRNLDVAKVKQRQEEANRLMKRAGVDLSANDKVALNDCSYMMDLSVMAACEAAWRIAGFPMHGSSHSVHRAFVHEEHKDVMYTNRGVSAAEVGEMLKKESRGMMIAWFEANQKPDVLPNGQMTTDLTLPDMFSYYMFNTQTQEFILRKHDLSRRNMGRIQAPQPRWLELTATRLLAQTVKGPTCWADLRTFRGVVHDTCLQAARARGLMNGDVEWDNALNEIAQTEVPYECRRFFVSILVHCAPANPKQLWENHWRQLINEKNTSWSVEEKKAHALRHIQFLLARHGMSLTDFELGSEYIEDDLPSSISPMDDIDNPNAVKLNVAQHKAKGEEMYKKLNRRQKKFVNRALKLDNQPHRKRVLFVDGPGGTGKTFCYETIYHILAGRQRKTICVSHTGIAACLLPNGCTAHRKFSIPLEAHDTMKCKIANGTVEGDSLAQVDCIIWDEICMSDRRVVNAVDSLLKELKNNDLPFGGVLMIMGGDWRQILPIVEGVRGYGVTDYTLKSDEMWNKIEKFKLTKNQRAISDPDYAKMILAYGNGDNYVDEKRKMVFIPPENVERSEKDLVNWVFPDLGDRKATQSAALLTVDNRTALRLNNEVLDRVDGQVREFISTDTADKENALSVDPAIFASETPSGMPPHRLRLKIGAQVVLLRNISVEQGLCNGTRLTIKEFGEDMIRCTVNTPTGNSPKIVFLHRMLLSPSGNGAKSCGFKRLQYPLRLAYACTINKSQGQTLSRCGLVLHSPVFSHGQLYVAMSRVQKSADFKLWHTTRKHAPSDDSHSGGILVRNVVFKDVLRDISVVETLESLDPRPPQQDNISTSSSEHSDSSTSSRFSFRNVVSGFKNLFKSK